MCWERHTHTRTNMGGNLDVQKGAWSRVKKEKQATIVHLPKYLNQYMIHGYGFWSKISDLSSSDKLGARSHVCSQSELPSEVVSLFRKPLLCMKLAMFLKFSGIISTNSSRPDQRRHMKFYQEPGVVISDLGATAVSQPRLLSQEFSSAYNCGCIGGTGGGRAPRALSRHHHHNSLTTKLLKGDLELLYDLEPEKL